MSKKYRQDGYQEDSKPSLESKRRQERPTREGPRSPRMPGFHKVMRCSMCGGQLPPSLREVEPTSSCPKCKAPLHTCKNCVYFDPASRLECTQPIKERIGQKNERNDCQYFEARTAVEKITTSSGERKPQDARQAFEDLFKK